MNITISICAFVLGGVLLPESDLPLSGPIEITTGQPLVELSPLDKGPSSTGWNTGYFDERTISPSAPADRGGGTTSRSVQDYPEAPFAEPAGPYDFTRSQGTSLPAAPTDPSATSSNFPLAPPTSASPADGAQTQQGTGPGASPTGYTVPGISGTGAYRSPTASRPSYQARNSLSPFDLQQARMSPGTGTSRALDTSGLASPKPFSGYQRPAAVSPYMELGRVGSYYQDVDNYNQYVKPRLEQQRAQFNSQVRGLQNNVRGLSGPTQSPQGVLIPQYFMNYGGYYPALQP